MKLNRDSSSQDKNTVEDETSCVVTTAPNDPSCQDDVPLSSSSSSPSALPCSPSDHQNHSRSAHHYSADASASIDNNPSDDDDELSSSPLRTVSPNSSSNTFVRPRFFSLKRVCIFVAVIGVISIVIAVVKKSLLSDTDHSDEMMTIVLPLHPRSQHNMTKTPPMGWNSWNLYECFVSDELLRKTADALVDTGLAELGYVFVNADDCWMLGERNATTRTQIPDPNNFPNGWKPVTDYLHSRCDMKKSSNNNNDNNNKVCGQNQLFCGLYTARGPHSCKWRAASCDHEAIDAAYYASVGIDYVKDDACTLCPGADDNEVYKRMWNGIHDTKRPMFLSVEADPNDTLITRGGYANSKRVGRDIKSFALSVYTLVDAGANLHQFAHNGDNKTMFTSTGEGFWNDLDMLEIGNGPDFVCGESAAAAARCRMHFSYWTIMKALLLSGNDVTTMDKETLSVLSNRMAIGINQDSLGVQARRVKVFTPTNNSLSAFNFTRNVGVIRVCDVSIPTQKWKFIPVSASAGSRGFLQTTTAEGEEVCLRQLLPWIGPNYEFFSVGPCPSPLPVPPTEFLFTFQDASSNNEQETAAPQRPCSSASPATAVVISENSNRSQSQGQEIVVRNCSFGPSFDNKLYATGPWPSSRYLDGNRRAPFLIEWDKVFATKSKRNNGQEGGYIIAADRNAIQDDDLVGGVKIGGDFCLDVTTMGTFEVWAGPLANSAVAVLFSNRSPARQRHCVVAEDIGANVTSGTSEYYLAVNVWTQEPEKIQFSESGATWCPEVDAFDVGYFVLSLRRRN